MTVSYGKKAGATEFSHLYNAAETKFYRLKRKTLTNNEYLDSQLVFSL